MPKCAKHKRFVLKNTSNYRVHLIIHCDSCILYHDLMWYEVFIKYVRDICGHVFIRSITPFDNCALTMESICSTKDAF